MRILITGAKGTLGRALVAGLQSNHEVTGEDVDNLDVTDSPRVEAWIGDNQPDLVVHCAALTAVDYCAENPDEALAVNGYGTQSVALACQKHNAALLYVSTNEVFDGLTDRQYLEYDTPAPGNPYAYSKWVGEQIVRDLVRQHTIVRTSWLFAHGGKNFVQTILRLAEQNVPLRVVTNEVSSPTYTSDLAAAICQLIQTGRYGIYHLVNEGYTSRCGFARAILDLAGYIDTPIEPIALAEYPRPSRPPQYAMLRNFAAARLGITLRPWQDALAAFLERENAGEQIG
ncbi:dTDP-4-dehydrorhamnose reductase [Aggregatilinea lenta]|uniref:dTDP-4-dehydrorhamnose reductase n=1 Tax=Aggregatilinea lenta TaxID=913108 RepID=UPI000E5B840F|nr:dTDP-4-dehydrorhamnose reductase [Aggregatilinea lenta]